MQADSGISLDGQRHKIEARCAENRWHLERIFVDAGVSGSTPLGRRPEGAKLLAAVRPGDVVIAAKMDRVFRSALDALRTIEEFKRRDISPSLLDLGDVSGKGVSEPIVTVLAALAQFELTLISERMKDAKRNLHRGNRHQGDDWPFGWRLGEANGHGKARELIPDPVEQAALADMIAMRAEGRSLMAIRDEMRARGFWISHQFVANTLVRHALVPAAGGGT
jgi:DNA invertase Pin-like site-specific DNA recombinase